VIEEDARGGESMRVVGYAQVTRTNRARMADVSPIVFAKALLSPAAAANQKHRRKNVKTLSH
jgi:hypothetical protein